MTLSLIRFSPQRWVVALLLPWLLLALPAQAARVQHLYTAELLVIQQAVQVETELAAEALAQVLVKVSGRRDIVEQAGIAQALASPQRYIQQFSYRSAGQLLTNADGVEVPAQRLRIDFVPSLVDQLLGEARFRPLGAVRPGVLVWIVEERGRRREFLGREEDPAFAPMRDRARERGLPIFRPLMDLQDQSALSVADAWGFFEEPVRAASERYQADAILVGRLFPDGRGWQSRWMLLHQGERTLFEGEGSALEQHLSVAVDQSADRLFADFVAPVDAGAAQGVIIEIGDVSRFDDYARIVDYLRETSLVREVQLMEQNGAVLTLELKLNGSVAQLARTLGLNNRFRRLSEPLQPLNDPALSYSWGG